MAKLTEFFDAYSIRARLRPALLILFPMLVMIASLFPVTYETISSGIGSLIIACGVLVLFAQITRYLGRKKEVKLYERWGGMPTTIWLRHRDTNIDPTTKKRYHAFFVKRVPKLKLPTAKEEEKNPVDADSRYLSATKWLLEYTRDKKKFPLVFEENVNYGFQRNTLALKPIANVILMLCLIDTTLFVYMQSGFKPSDIEQGAYISLGVSISALIVWNAVVTSSWVKDAAHAYARALLASCDN